MSPALSLTGDDLVRALAGLAGRPAVDRAVATRAETLASEIARAAGDAVSVRVVRRGPGDYAVEVTGTGASDPAVAAAIAQAGEAA